MTETQVFDSLLNKLFSQRMVDKIAILSIPIWILNKLFPQYFYQVRSTVYFQQIPYLISDIIEVSIYLLTFLGYVYLLSLAVVIGIWIFNKVLYLSSYVLIGGSHSYLSCHRDNLIKGLFIQYLYNSLYLTALTIYQEMLFNVSAHNILANNYLVSILPIGILGLLMLLALVLS